MTISEQEKEMFKGGGVLHLKGLISKSKAFAAKEAVLRELERLKFRVNGKWHTKQFKNAPGLKIASRVSQSIRHQEQFSRLIPEELTDGLNRLAETKLVPGQLHPQLLISPPQKEAWSLPHLGWHLDIASPSSDHVPGVQVFVLIDDVAPRGGGTVALAGSHKLHGTGNSSADHLYETLRNDTMFRNLFTASGSDRSHLFVPTLVDGVEVCVVEMFGKAGDAYLMDMRVLHAPAPNASKNARMVATGRFLRGEGHWQEK